MKLILLIVIGLFLVSCGQKISSNCDTLNSSGSVLGSTTYDCPSGDPAASDLIVSQLSGLDQIEAGFNYNAIVSIKNSGSAKIFDFLISSSSNIQILQNTCSTKLYPGDVCSVGIKISELIAGQKTGYLKFDDRTGKLNKIINVNYVIKSSYPETMSQLVEEIDYKTKKITIGPLFDRYGNKVNDPYIITTNRFASIQNISPYINRSTTQSTDSTGKFSFYVQTDQLESTLSFDTAEVSIISDRIFANGSISAKNLSLTYVNNKPFLSAATQSFSVSENSFSNQLLNLIAGEDKKNRALTYRIINKPLHGVLHNCLIGDTFVSLVNCSYTPNKNFHGIDTFTYIVNNGITDSVNHATVSIDILHSNVAPILSGIKSIRINQDESYTFNLPQAFDADDDILSYMIVNNPTHGLINCNGFTCIYSPVMGYIGSDSISYKAKDSNNAESNIFILNFNIGAVNHAPSLGGAISYNTSENQAITFVLPIGTDSDIGDSLTYKIKNNPTKGVLTGCLNNTTNLSCTYTPNLYENTSEIFSYVAIDSKGTESVPKVVTINIAQVNSAPYFSNLYQEEQVLPNGTINFAILNSIDPEGNLINYILENPIPNNGGLLSSCLINNNLNCTYSAPSGVTSGSYSFQYKAQDSLGLDSSLRTVKLIIGTGNTAPTLSGIMNVNANEDAPIAFNLIQGSDGETPQQFLKYKIGVIKPQKGTLSKCADQVNSNGLTDISCEYKPNENATGSDSFSYYVIDGRNNQSTELTVNISINSINDAPVFANNNMDVSLSEDQPTQFSIDNAIDPESDLITYRIKQGNTPQHGSLSSGCYLNVGVANNCTYTPDLNYFGTDETIIQAVDVNNEYSEKIIRFTINPVNDSPTFLSNLITKNVQEDGDNFIALDSANDIDSTSDSISYTVVTLPTKGLLSGCLGINAMQGLNCLYLPFSNEMGIDTFSYKANDGLLDSTVVTVSLNIQSNNDYPFFEVLNVGPIKVARGEPVSFDLIKAKDVENNNLMYEVVSSPANGTLSNCFSGSNLTCTYQSAIDYIGDDSFTYRAKDLNNSINIVNVSFSVGDKKNDRIYKLNNNLSIDYAQKQSLSVDKNIYSVGDNIILNLASSATSYISNSTYMRYANGEMKQLFPNGLVNYKVVLKDEKLYFFDESSSGNFLRIADKNGDTKSISYTTSNNIFYPIIFNGNIYAGSNRSTLYKINLTKIGQADYSWVEPLVTNSMLGISSSGKLVETYGVVNNELYFSFYDDNNRKILAKIKQNDALEILTSAMDTLQDVVIYDTSVTKKVIFTASLNGTKKLYSYNPLEININNKLRTVVSADYLPGVVTNPKIFKAATGTVIVYLDTVNNKIAGLDPVNELLIEYEDGGIKDFAISKNFSKMTVLKTDGSVLSYSDNPILNGGVTIAGLSAQNIYGAFDDLFIAKSGSDIVVIDGNVYNYINKQDSYIFEDNIITSGDKFFLYKFKTNSISSLYDVYEYKRDMLFNLNKGKINLLNGLYADSGATTYNVIAQPQFGQISNCMGLNSSGILNTSCNYTPDVGFIGQDSFKYTISKNGSAKEYLVKIKVNNSKPEIQESAQIADIVNISNLNGEINSYFVLNDEIYFSIKRINTGFIYRYNRAEGLKLIEKNNNGYDKITGTNGFLFYVDKGNSNKIKFYDIGSKLSGYVFNEEQTSPTLIVKDIILNNQQMFAIVTNYGNTLISRMVKINLGDYHADLIGLPSNYENGKFVRLGSMIGIQTDVKISTYNETLDSFTNTVTATDTFVSGNVTTDSDANIMTQSFSSSGLFKTYFFKQYDYLNAQLNKILEFSFSGTSFESYIVKKFNIGTSLTGLFEIKDNSDGFSSVLLYRKGLPYNDLFSETSVNFIPIFNEKDGEMSSMVKQFDNNLYVVKHDDNWANATFSFIGYETNFYVLNHNTTEIRLPSSQDKDSDLITYELVNPPAYGTLSNCLGMNNVAGLNCLYSHTDGSSAVVDSFSYRAFDGYEYSSPKTIVLKIKNNAPYFETASNLNIEVPLNYGMDISLDEAKDDDGNELHYIITQIPTKGVLTGCSVNTMDSQSLNRLCHYVPNNNQTGLDLFKFRVFDGMSYSIEKTININILTNPTPVFSTYSQQIYLQTGSSFIITLEKAIDPQNGNLTYEITQQPSNGTLSNCFVINLNKLQCTYTPTNSSNRSLDSFKYRANNGAYVSSERTVNVLNTGSLMTGALGSLHVTESGVYLIKNGLNNITALSTLGGYNWDVINKILTLPANIEYNFESINIDDNTKVIFKPFDSGILSKTPGWTRVYSQSHCVINGVVKLTGVQIPGIANVTVQSTSIDSELLSYVNMAYPNGVYGGLSGGNSNSLKNAGFYGSPTLIKASNGQIANGDIGLEPEGGKRGFDGNALFMKCIESISGSGVIDVSGSNGDNGIDGQVGGQNDINHISYGGAGGSGGGNGGNGGMIKMRTFSNNFNGSLIYNGGAGGIGGVGGVANVIYSIPYTATKGSNGQNGINGQSGQCLISDLIGVYNNCN